MSAMTARKLAKRVVKTAFLVLSIPLYLSFRLISLFGNTDGCFSTCSQALSLIPGKAGVYLRAAFYHLSCPETSDEISIGFLTVLSHQKTSIAEGVYIGPQCNIGMCAIGENTLIGSGVHILSGNKQHAFNRTDIPIQEQAGKYLKVEIGEDSWLGNGSIVMCSLGSRTIVAAGSVVTKPSSGNEIIGGNPAKKLSS